PSGRFSAGERVLFFAGPGGVTQDGTFAEITSVPSGNLASLPGEIADEIAAGLPVAYLSVFLALRQAGFRAGQSVLAPGAGGSVGNATLKVARALGASQLVSTAGSSVKEAAAAADGGLREVGIVSLQHESLADGLARLAPCGVDIAINALGGPVTGQAEAYGATLPLIAGGQITAARDRSFPLQQAPEALRHLVEDRPFGKVTLTVGELSAG